MHGDPGDRKVSPENVNTPVVMTTLPPETPPQEAVAVAVPDVWVASTCPHESTTSTVNAAIAVPAAAVGAMTVPKRTAVAVMATTDTLPVSNVLPETRNPPWPPAVNVMVASRLAVVGHVIKRSAENVAIPLDIVAEAPPNDPDDTDAVMTVTELLGSVAPTLFKFSNAIAGKSLLGPMEVVWLGELKTELEDLKRKL